VAARLMGIPLGGNPSNLDTSTSQNHDMICSIRQANLFVYRLVSKATYVITSTFSLSLASSGDWRFGCEYWFYSPWHHRAKRRAARPIGATGQSYLYAW
jgi:hypothetical protein